MIRTELDFQSFHKINKYLIPDRPSYGVSPPASLMPVEEDNDPSGVARPRRSNKYGDEGFE